MDKNKKNSPAPTAPSGSALPAEQRRGFFTQAAAIVIGGLVGLFPALAGLLVFFDPARRKSNGGNWIRVATIDAVPDDGVPRYFPVVVDKRDDAWTRYLNEPIGAIYLIREKGKQDITAFNATCPHAGCMVDYLGEKNYFQCPCHTSAFDCQGKRMMEISEVPPRDMDSLDCRIEVAKNGGQEIHVKYQDFYTGKEDKVAKL